MTNYDQSELVSICYNPGIPTDQDFGNISIPELTFRYNFVDSLEFSTYTIGFTAEQLIKKRNGDTFIGELNFIGIPSPENPYEPAILKFNIKFYYTPLKKNISWKYDKSNGISIDYTGIRFVVTKYFSTGASSESQNHILDPMENFTSTIDGFWLSPLYLYGYCKSALSYMDNHPDDPVVYTGRENYNNLMNSAIGSFYTLSFYVYREDGITPMIACNLFTSFTKIKEWDITIPGASISKYCYINDDGIAEAVTNLSEFMVLSLDDLNLLNTLSDEPFDGNSGTNGPGSIGGGGYGFWNDDRTGNQPLPTTSIIDTGMCSIYLPSKALLKDFSNYLWSADFFDNVIKNYQSPLENIISLSIIPAIANPDDARYISIGNCTTNILCTITNEQYVSVECGSINLKEHYGNFSDYSPNTSIDIYLPYIGYRQIDIDDFMAGKIRVRYQCDILTGDCVAEIYSEGKGKSKLMYTFNGNISYNVPLSGANYLQYYLSIVSGIGNVATGVAQGIGGNPLGGIGAAASGVGQILTSKPAYGRSGSLGSAAGYLSYRRPFLVRKSPINTTAKNLAQESGYISNKGQKIGDYSGFTKCAAVVLDGITATKSELDEIETLLKEGVII